MQKSRDWFYILISLFLLALGTFGLMRQISVSQMPPEFPWETVQWPLEVAGVTVSNADDLVFLVEGFRPGELLQAMLSTGPQTFITIAAHSHSYLIIATFSGLFFWIVAFVVFTPRLNLPAVTQFYWITMLYGLGILLGGVYFQFGLTPLGMILNTVQLCNLAFLPAIFLDMALVFPRRIVSDRSMLMVRLVIYSGAILLVVWQIMMFGRYFLNPSTTTSLGLGRPQLVADLVMVGQATLAMTIMLVQAGKLEPGRERKQARWLLTGFMVGATPYLFFRTLPMLFSMEPPFPAHVDRLFEPAIPLAFVFAVVRLRFLDIDLILRRGILYGILAAGMAGLVLTPTALMGPENIIRWPRYLQMLPVLFGVLAGFLFLPLRGLLARWIDRIFFRIEHRVDGIVHEFKLQLKSVSSQEDLANLVHEIISSTVHPEPCFLLLENMADEIRIGDRNDLYNLSALSCEHSPTPLWVQPNSSTCPEKEDEKFPQAFFNEGLMAALKLEVEGKAVGCVLLGPKHNGHRYVETDLKFMSAVAVTASERLQEISLVQKMAEENIKRSQLSELNKLKDDFLSRVAHDLRTPVTSVGWSIHNLLDGLAGELDPRQRTYLQSMDNSLKHLNNLVSTLLEISRLKNTHVEIKTTVCDLPPVLFQVLDTVQPLAKAAGVELNCSQPEIPLQLVTHSSKLVEVLINILENGIRYSPLGAVLEIHAEGQKDQVVLKVRDHGPGFREISNPFARFAQGQSSPHGSEGGYGLGLTIAQEYTQLMGGGISARNHPTGGAEFTLKLPRSQAMKEKN